MRFAFVLALACVAACSPATPTPEIAKPIAPTDDGGMAGPGFATPAKWALSFSPRWRPVATIQLDSGSTLHAGDGGERWIESVSGSNDGASTLAPERIVGIQRADGGYRFVGASGTVYVAHDALGTLMQTGNPVAGARQVAVGKTAILVVDGKGDLERSTDGGHAWSKVDLPSKEGIVVDVAMLGDKGILVAAPQRFYGTKDDGVTWTVAKSPGVGVQTVVARDGALWVDGVEDSMRFDPAWGTFQAGPSTSRGGTHRPFTPPKLQPNVVTRLDGRHAVQVSGNGTERVWTIAIGDTSGLGKTRKIDELDGCELVDVAIRGDDVVIACDARGSVASGIDKDATSPVRTYQYGRSSGPPDSGTLGWITRIVRSSDGGRTFREETTVEGGIPQRSDVAIALGPEDFVYLGRRCSQGYNAPCIGARVRATKSAGFSEVPGEDDSTPNSGHMRFATNGLQAAAYSVGMRDGEAFLFRWKSGSAVAEPVGRIAPSIDAQSATLSLDDDGTVRGFAHAGKNAFTFSYKEGGTITTTNLQVPFSKAAFAGIHGFGVMMQPGEIAAYESVDGGKTWGLVGSPAYIAAIDACSTFGCVTDRGLRWGWDAPKGTPDGTASPIATANKSQYARPLRCSAKDKWIELGGGNLPNVSDVDHGNVRWLLPTRDKDGKMSIVMSKRGEATTKTSTVSLLGVPPAAPKFGSGTTVYVQPDGVVALRYVYTRDRKGPGRYNPVDAQLAWYRDATGKVFRASVNKNPPFRVNKDPQSGYERDAQPMYGDLPQLVQLAPKGVYFHIAQSYDEDDSGNEPKRVPLMLVRDDGKTEKMSLPEGADNAGGVGIVASLDGTTTLLSHNPENWLSTTLSDGHKTFYSVLGGLGNDDGIVDFITASGKPAFAATLRNPARSWLIGLKADPDLGTVTPIATQKSLGDTPKPCDGVPASDPNAYRIDSPYVIGSRRPVVVDSDGVAIVLATGGAEIRGTLGQPDACVAAFDAMTPAEDGDHDYGALIFTDDLGHSLLFRADSSTWPAPIAVRPMDCQYQAGPLPEELESVEGFLPDSHHSAVPQKRY
jgi:hypothetical protein